MSDGTPAAPGTPPPTPAAARDDDAAHARAASTADRARLAAVQVAALTDTPALERVARIAARALRVPVAQVNVVTADAQVPLASATLPEALPDGDPGRWAGPVGIDASFCRHVVDAGDDGDAAPLLIEDARVHPLVRDSRVIADAGVVAYAAAPLRTADGQVLGTVCVVDFAPRAWSAADAAVLAELAELAVDEIAARRAAEAALAEQSALTGLVAENATAALFFMDHDGHPTYMNAAAEAMTGFALREIAGMPLHYAVHHRRPDGSLYPMADCPIDRALPEHFDVRAHEDVFIRRDGSFFPVVCAASPILREGVPVGTVVEVRDVTAEKAAAAALRELTATLQAQNEQLQAQGLELELSNQQLREQTVELELQTEELQAAARDLQERTEEAERARADAEAARRRMLDTFESISDPFFTVDHDWVVTYVNPPTERVIGRPRDSIVGRHLWEQFPEAVGTPFYEGAHRALRDGCPVDVEAHYPPPLDFWAAMRMYPLADGLAVYYQDVTRRKRAEEALRASEQRLRDVFEQAPVAVAVLAGPDHVYTVMSPRYAAFLPVGEAGLGRPFREAVPEIAGQGVAELMDHVYATGEPLFAHERLVRLDRDADGVLEDYWFDIGYQPLRDADGRVYAIASVSLEVTAHVVARRELEAARATAEAANRAKSEFLSTMSHELRTPLNAIGGYTELLELGVRGPITDEQRADLARIRRANQHLQSLINDILNFARLEAGHVRYELRDVPVDEALADVEALVLPQLRERGLDHFREPRAGAAAGAPSVRADAEKLRQILLNLLTNAIKFTPPAGRITLGWSLELDDAGAPQTVHVRVRDTGRGIPADQLERIFEPFVQVDRHLTGASQQGVGLGLAISRDLARGMDGELSVESTPGAGSTFTLTLPAGRPVVDDAPATATDAAVVTAATDAIVREARAALAAGGAYAVLALLNARTSHRFTGLYRFDAPTLRSVVLVDRDRPEVRRGDDAPMRETFCAIVGATERLFATADAQAAAELAAHPARDAVVSYCGVLVRDGAGRPVGTLCHFDGVRRVIPDGEVPVLEAVAVLLADVASD